MKRIAATNVDEYIASLQPPVQIVLDGLRKIIKAALPHADEVISYQIPTYRDKDGPIGAFAAFEKHCSFYTMSHSIMNVFTDELKPYDTSGVTIRFTADNPLPARLVKKLLMAKMKENTEKIAERRQKN